MKRLRCLVDVLHGAARRLWNRRGLVGEAVRGLWSRRGEVRQLWARRSLLGKALARLVAGGAGVLHIALLRLWSHRGLMACAAAGLVTAVSLSVGIPLYADAVHHRLLQERVETEAGEQRPPFSFLIQYVGVWDGLEEWEHVAPVDDYLRREAASTLRMPQKQMVRLLRTDQLRLFATGDVAYGGEGEEQTHLAWVALGAMSDLEGRVQMLEGRLPAPSAAGEPLEVMITLPFAETLGLQVGEEYVVYAPQQDEGMTEGVEEAVRIVGVWWPANPDDVYWMHRSYTAFETVLLTAEESFLERFAPSVKGEIGYAEWFIEFDGSGVRAEDVLGLLGGIRVLEGRLTTLLPNTRVPVSPADALYRYRREALLLTILLYLFSIPLFGLVLYFIALVAGMIVSRQRNELAVLRSRGMTSWQVIGIYVLEGVVVGLVALVVGSLVAHVVAQWMGHTTSFLVLGSKPLLATRLGWGSLRFGLVAVGASLVTSVVPAIGAARHTIVTYKQEQARSLRKPFWQRAYLDLLLLIPAVYGYYMLRERGTISVLGGLGAEGGGSPFGNPLLFLLPTLFIFALSLTFVRLVPAVMRLLAWLGERGRGVVAVLALRHLARSPGMYVGPLLLLILTLSLAVFTASMASTLDAHLTDQAYYESGGDILLEELGESTQTPAGVGFGSSAGRGGGEEGKEEIPGPDWRFLPVEDHLLIPGVKEATRLGRYEMTVLVTGRKYELIGVDRASLPLVMPFREDYAQETLAGLMNGLAAKWNGLLVDQRSAAENGWRVGDVVNAQLWIGKQPEVAFEIVGMLKYFPTVYPEDGRFAVANLGYLHEQVGGTYPYDVLLTVEEGVRAEQVVEGARKLGFRVINSVDGRTVIEREQENPSRQGVFGLLSVGFLAAAFLTMLGYLIYSYVSFQQRFIQLGVLRAIGLSVEQMTRFLAGEQLAVIGAGLVGGTLLGSLTTQLFVPFLQVRTGAHPLTPPFVVQIAWGDVAIIYVIFGLVLVGAVAILTALLRRMNIFQVVKLGEIV